jgi:hypothetical protein
LIAPDEAVHLAETTRASAPALYVWLAAETYSSNRRVKASTRHHQSLADRFAGSAESTLGSCFDLDALTNIQDP